MKKIVKILSLLILAMMVATTCFATNSVPDEVSIEELEDDDIYYTTDDDVYDYSDYITSDPYDYQYGDIYASDTEGLDANTVVYGNVYLVGDNLNIEVTAVLGNLFVIGDDVTIKVEEITGSVFVIGKNVKIEGVIDTSVYAIGEELELNIQTYGVYAMGENVTITEDTLIILDARLAGNTVTFNGTTSQGGLYTDCENLIIGDNSSIYGNIEYTNNVSIPDSIEESQLVKKEGMEVKADVLESIVNKMNAVTLAISIVTTIFVLILIGVIIPSAEKYETDLKEYILKDIITGLLFIVVIPILSILLMVTVVGAGVGLVALTLYFIALIIFAIPVACVEFAKCILGDRATSKTKVIILAIGLRVAISLLTYVPYVGGIVCVVSALYGMGLIVRKIFFRKKCNHSDDKNITVESVKAEETVEEDTTENIVKAIDEIEPEVVKEEASSEVITENVKTEVPEEENEIEPIISNDDENKEE